VQGPQEGYYKKDVKSKVAAKKWPANSKKFNNDNSGKSV